jgi:hypothetical protein
LRRPAKFFPAILLGRPVDEGHLHEPEGTYRGFRDCFRRMNLATCPKDP